MGLLRKFESMMQGIVEGSFGKVFRSSVQPVELQRRLAREMENNLQISQDRRNAPNIYAVYLSHRDYSALQPQFGSLVYQLQESLIAVARDRGYTLSMRPRIDFQEDGNLITGQIRAHAEYRDPHYAQMGADGAAGAAGADETRTMSPEEAQQLRQQVAQAQQDEALPPAWLTLYKPARGEPQRLTKAVIHIGRHLTNDVVVNDKRVSRFHAEIRYERGQFVLYDLGSTNGVGINGVLTHNPVPLKNNDLVGVGSHEFVFQRR
ncbi:MAG: hypothetical protein OJF49_003469 [Ktedonobacterales bacterium]|jgi:hypothetical protein|nr:MAG: hypothetical protein OJF49_003469 [Ktedonobacterales bacterium]